MSAPITTWDTGIAIPEQRKSGWAEIARTIPKGGSILFPHNEKPASFKQALRNAGRTYVSRTRVMERDGEAGLRLWLTSDVGTTAEGEQL